MYQEKKKIQAQNEFNKETKNKGTKQILKLKNIRIIVKNSIHNTLKRYSFIGINRNLLSITVSFDYRPYCIHI